MSAVLSIRNLSVRFGARYLLHRVDLDIPRTGIVAVLGPGGAGKSTLLRALARRIPASRPLACDGEITFDGRPLDVGHHPWIGAQQLSQEMTPASVYVSSAMPDRASLSPVEQRDRVRAMLDATAIPGLVDQIDCVFADLSYIHRRALTIVQAIASGNAMIALDEPLAGIDDDDALPLLALLQRASAERAILFVTHNQSHARSLASHVAMFAAGQLVEFSSADHFFSSPKNPLTRRFTETGGCELPSVTAAPDDLSDEWVERRQPFFRFADEERRALPLNDGPAGCVDGRRGDSVRVSAGRTGFVWLVSGELAGCPEPGIFEPTERDLERLRLAGITVLVSLTGEPASPELVRAAGIEPVHMPIVDMAAPAPGAAMAAVCQMETRIAAGKQVAYHCRAGIGRTGTMLVAHLIGRGLSFEEALRAARQRRAEWVQSAEQMEFLRQLPPGFSGRQRTLPRD